MVFQTKSILIFLLAGFALMISCSKESEIATVVLDDAGLLPYMHAENVNSLISDSGITRYRLKAKIWDMYEAKTLEAYWHFPEGIYVEKFDSLFRKMASVEADTAYFYKQKELWQLKGNVHVQNIQGDEFDTSELFWSQRAPANSYDCIYTDSTVYFKLANKIEQGVSYGIKFNQDMSKYRLYRNGESFMYSDEDLATDTVTTP